jgi:hypothetical protein
MTGRTTATVELPGTCIGEDGLDGALDKESGAPIGGMARSDY